MPSPALRLFAACYPPETAATGMVAMVASRSWPRHKITPVFQLHMTLQFIGDTLTRDLEGVKETVSRAASGLARFTLTPQRLITLPQGRDPRLIAITTDAPAPLMELHRRLVTRLARRIKKRENFLPHITLARFHPDAEALALDEPIDLPAFDIDRIRLMRSVLKPDGAEHVEVSTAQLG